MRAALLLSLLLGCNHLLDDNTAPSDLSAAADMAGGLCPGLDVGFQKGSCTPKVGTGWLGNFCYPDNFTYCACVAGQWECCGDLPPRCPDTPPATGDYCCPGGAPGTLSCKFGGDGGMLSCVCGDDLRWQCF